MLLNWWESNPCGEIEGEDSVNPNEDNVNENDVPNNKNNEL